MKQISILLLLICNCAWLFGQDNIRPTFASYKTTSTVKKTYFRLGEKVVTLVKQGVSIDENYVVVSLHNNEYTASEAARSFVNKHGGVFLELLNDNQRNIEFSLFNRDLVVDPNNIFTPKGRWNDLAVNQKKDHIISQQIGEFANFIIEELPLHKTIISVHNNAEGEYTVNHYLKNQSLSRNARMVFTNAENDANDFFVTTDKDIFEKLKEKNFNVVLQSVQARDDGSLGVFCSKTRRSYIGIETRTGHFNQQEAMINAVAEILK